MLSVFDTLKETLFLWVRNFWYLVVLTLIVDLPITIFQEVFTPTKKASIHEPGEVIWLLGTLAGLLLVFAKDAGIWGLLSRDAWRKTVVESVIYSIRHYTWTLFRLGFLIALIALFFVGGFTLILHALGAGRSWIIIATGFYLVFVKYALADPLVVLENFNAMDALQRSWQMTKGHFGYVAGCYLLVGLGDRVVYWLVETHLKHDVVRWAWVLAHLARETIGSFWIILSLRMYHRIKALDELSEAPASNN